MLIDYKGATYQPGAEFDLSELRLQDHLVVVIEADDWFMDRPAEPFTIHYAGGEETQSNLTWNQVQHEILMHYAVYFI